jgi:hypothetical protein
MIFYCGMQYMTQVLPPTPTHPPEIRKNKFQKLYSFLFKQILKATLILTLND